MPPRTTLLTDELAASLIGALTLEQKVRLLTGASFWTLHDEPAIGLEQIVLSDGPAGVRGQSWDERDSSLSLPSPTALAASWDVEKVERLGALIGAEARRKGVHVVLGPNVNIQRSPRAGRHFEAFSEDPHLSGIMGAAYVRGVQSQGIAATPKHFVANDSETDRMTADVRVDERTLREVYLAPFERIVADAQPWLLMSSYNSVNGITMTEHPLLSSPLKDEWGFDGVVVSDWMAVRDTTAAAAAAQDLAMPGPDGVWGDALVRSVKEGHVKESAIDAKVLRLLRLAGRLGALNGVSPSGHASASWSDDDATEALTDAAASGMVLATNTGLLPIDTTEVARIAVIGQHANHGRGQGGGSATVFPPHEVSPLVGIRTAFPGATVEYAPGAPAAEPLLPLDIDIATDPVSGIPGLNVRFLGHDGTEILNEHRTSGRLFWVGDEILQRTAVVEVRAVVTAPSAGTYALGFAGLGDFTFTVNDEVRSHGLFFPEGTDPFMAFLNPPTQTFPIYLDEGERAEVLLVHRPAEVHGIASVTFTLGYEEPIGTAGDELERAVQAAARADVAIVVVGTTEHLESEGFDRADVNLPGDQDALVAAVIAANPRTIVVINAGAPVIMPWLDDAAAVLLAWFPGQEFGRALADVIVGAREPGGRLTHTWPTRQEDVPVWQVEPSDGRLLYSEGIHVGYREWSRREALGGPAPALAFGHGLGYTEWDLESAAVVSCDTESTTLSLSVTNSGSRKGKTVVQVYASRVSASAVDWPTQWLVGFVVVHAEPGQTTSVETDITTRALQYWNTEESAWRSDPGDFALTIAWAADRSVLTLPITVGPPNGLEQAALA
jgi:beta-glucosidase